MCFMILQSAGRVDRVATLVGERFLQPKRVSRWLGSCERLVFRGHVLQKSEPEKGPVGC